MAGKETCFQGLNRCEVLPGDGYIFLFEPRRKHLNKIKMSILLTRNLGLRVDNSQPLGGRAAV